MDDAELSCGRRFSAEGRRYLFATSLSSGCFWPISDYRDWLKATQAV
jgi:hypothetical protein